MFFQNQFGNVEVEAINCAFLSIASQLINEINPKFITLSAVKTIHQLSLILTDPYLKKEMLTKFVFKIKIRNIEDASVVSAILDII